MDKLDLILEKLNQFDTVTNQVKTINDKLDKMQSDITSLRTDNKEIHQKLDMLIDEVANGLNLI